MLRQPEPTPKFGISPGAEALRICVNGKPMQVVKLDDADGYVGELSRMIGSIRRKRPPTTVTAKDDLAAVQVCEAEEESALTGKLVTL